MFNQAKLNILSELCPEREIKYITVTHDADIKIRDVLFGEYGSKLDTQVDKILHNTNNKQKLDINSSTYIDNLLETANYRKTTLNKIKKLSKQR